VLAILFIRFFIRFPLLFNFGICLMQLGLAIFPGLYRTDCTEDDFFFYYFCSLGCDCDCELLARIFHLHLWPECELDSVDFPFQAFPMPGGCPAL